MRASDLLSLLKKIIKGLIICNIVLVIAIIVIVYSFLHYLSLYDFTNSTDQYVGDIDTVENSNIEQNNN